MQVYVCIVHRNFARTSYLFITPDMQTLYAHISRKIRILSVTAHQHVNVPTQTFISLHDFLPNFSHCILIHTRAYYFTFIETFRKEFYLFTLHI